jgi:hypothetical protein
MSGGPTVSLNKGIGSLSPLEVPVSSGQSLLPGFTDIPGGSFGQGITSPRVFDIIGGPEYLRTGYVPEVVTHQGAFPGSRLYTDLGGVTSTRMDIAMASAGKASRPVMTIGAAAGVLAPVGSPGAPIYSSISRAALVSMKSIPTSGITFSPVVSVPTPIGPSSPFMGPLVGNPNTRMNAPIGQLTPGTLNKDIFAPKDISKVIPVQVQKPVGSQVKSPLITESLIPSIENNISDIVSTQTLKAPVINPNMDVITNPVVNPVVNPIVNPVNVPVVNPINVPVVKPVFNPSVEVPSIVPSRVITPIIPGFRIGGGHLGAS